MNVWRVLRAATATATKAIRHSLAAVIAFLQRIPSTHSLNKAPAAPVIALHTRPTTKRFSQ